MKLKIILFVFFTLVIINKSIAQSTPFCIHFDGTITCNGGYVCLAGNCHCQSCMGGGYYWAYCCEEIPSNGGNVCFNGTTGDVLPWPDPSHGDPCGYIDFPNPGDACIEYEVIISSGCDVNMITDTYTIAWDGTTYDIHYVSGARVGTTPDITLSYNSGVLTAALACSGCYDENGTVVGW